MESSTVKKNLLLNHKILKVINFSIKFILFSTLEKEDVAPNKSIMNISDNKKTSILFISATHIQ